MFSLPDIVLLWKGDISYSVVSAWYRVGVLPDPYTMLGRSPMWLRDQVQVIHQLINKHWASGRRRLDRRHINTIRAMHDGSDHAVDLFNARIARIKRRERVTHMGIEWIDLPDPVNARIDRKDRRVKLVTT